VSEALEGTTLGRYRIDRVLGAGGMGAVYAGVQEPLGRPVAIKVLHGEFSTDPLVVARFKREAEVAASLSHPNIASVTDFGIEAGRAFLVMDLLDGESLAERIASAGQLDETTVVRFALQILTALSVAHGREVVHRDLKPENIFVQDAGGVELVKLLDFGIARVMEVDASMTRTGTILGTPAYMSPEQARGKSVDVRSDLFSLGAVLHEALTGQRVFAGENYHELMFAVAEHDPPPLSSLDPSFSPALSAIVERALAKDPNARFATASEMKDALVGLTGLRSEASTLRRVRTDDAFAPTMESGPDQEPSTAPETAGASTAPEAGSPEGAAPATPPVEKKVPWLWVALGLVIAAAGWFGGALFNGGSEADPPGPEVAASESGLADASGTAMRPLAPRGSVEGGEASEAEVVAGVEREGASEGESEGESESESEGESESESESEGESESESGSESEGASESESEGASESGSDAQGGDASGRSRDRRAARRARPERVTMSCGVHSHQVEMLYVRRQHRLRVTGAAAFDGALWPGRSLRPLINAVNEHAEEVTACFRNQAINQGQSWQFLVDPGADRARRFAPTPYCPVPPAVVSCVQGILSSLPVANEGTGGGFRVYFSVMRP